MLPQHHHDNNTIVVALQALAFVRVENNMFQYSTSYSGFGEEYQKKI
jgi:hypothetical protein